MPAVYNKLGLHFQYPENWTLDESEAEGEVALPGGEACTVSLYSPGGAFWTVVRRAGGEDPRRCAEASLDAMRQEYQELDVEPVEETVAGHHLVGYNLNFFCLDLTNTTQIRSVCTPDATLLIFCQADDREFDRVEQVFRAITTSLLSHEARLT